MSSKNLNAETKEKLAGEYKRVRQRCIDTCNIIENSSLDASINQDNVIHKANAYMEGLRTDIENSNTPILADKNLITSLYLAEMKTKTEHVEELIAFTKGAIRDTSNEIERLNNLTKPAKEALSKPRVVHKAVRSEHIQKAKETFHMMKNELQGLIQSLFPHLSEHILEFMRQLMQERLNEESNGYIQITDENFAIVEMLSDMCIVTANPYNNNEVKLAY